MHRVSLRAIVLASGLLVVAAALLAAGSRVRALLAVSLQLGVWASVIAIPLATLLALLLTKTNLPGRRVAWLLLGGLMLLPLYLHAAAWQAGFGLLGWATQAAAAGGPIDPWLAGTRGAVWVHAMAATPWATLIIAAALRGVAAEQEESALLDAAPATVLSRVTLRRAAAGVGLAASWTMITCVAEIAATDLFNVRTFAEEVYTQAALGMLGPGAGGAAAGAAAGVGQTESGPQLLVTGLTAAVVLLVVVAAFAINLGRFLLAAPNEQEAGRRWAWRLGRGKPVGAVVLVGLLTLVAAVPIGSLAYQAGVKVTRIKHDGANAELINGEWARSWSSAKLLRMIAGAPWEHRRELAPSLLLATLVASSAVLFAVPLAWLLRGGEPWRLVGVLLIAAGLVVPAPLIGIGVIRLLNHPTGSPFAWLTWFYDETWFAPWLVQSLKATPLATLAVWPALAAVPRELIDSAATDGVRLGGALWRVAAPIRLAAVGAAWVVGFAAGFGELAATLLVLPPGPQTVTVRVFSLLHYGVEDRVAALCLLLVGGYLILGAWGAWFVGKTRLNQG